MLDEKYYKYIKLTDINIGGIVSDDDYYYTRLTREDVGEIYGIYLRKSREDRETEKYDNIDTLDRHEKILLEYTSRHKIKIGHIYREVVSGETISEREEMRKLLRDVEKGRWTGVLVMEVERLARGDTADQGTVATTFKYSATKIVTPSKTYDPNNEFDEEYFEFGLFMSRREYKTINRRLQRGRLTSVMEGKFVSSMAPFGYRKKKLENGKGFTLEIYEEEANIVKYIFDLFAYQGLSINAVVEAMNKTKMKPQKAEEWTISTIKDILSNPEYNGKIRWNARKEVIEVKNGKRIRHRPRNKDATVVEGLHPAIIDNDTWNIAQSKRSLNTPPVVHNNVVQNPLVGIVYCAKCGKTMQRRPYTLLSKEPTLMCNNPKCDNISSKLYIVEKQIIESLKIWLSSYKVDCSSLLSKKIEREIMTKRNMIKQLQTNLEKEKGKRNKIYDLFEEGVYDKEEFSSRISTVKEIISHIESELEALKQNVKSQEELEKEKQNVIPKIVNVIDLYEKLETSEEKNNLLKTILEKVTYLKTEKAIKKNSDPTNFEIHIYPKIPKSK